MVVVKFQYGNDVRRITLPDTIAYEEVLSVVERIYGDNALPREFNLKYTDEEKDLIKLTSDNELRDVISNLQEGKILRLTIVDANPAPSSTGISVAAIDENLHNTLCRHCGRQVHGVLYVCANCASADHYSLCAECEVQRPHDPQHVFLKVYAPLPPDALARVLPLPNLYAPSAPGAAAQSRGAREASADCPNWIRQRKNVVDLGRAACYQTGTGDRQEQGDANKLACRFVADITVDDGHEASPGSPFVKIWRLRNSGHAAWPEGVTLSFVSGDCLSSFDSVPVIAVSPGAEVDVSVDMVAPMETGRYVSNWRLRSPSGVFFGHRVWADVTVAARPPDGDLEKSNGRNEGGGQSVQNEDDDDIVDEDDEESDREWGQIRRNKVHKIAKVIRSSLNSDVDTYDEDAEDENEGEAQVQAHKEEEEEVEEEEEEKSTEEVVEERSGDEEAEKSELPALETLPVEAKEGDAEDDGEWEVVQQPEEWADELATLMEMSLGDGETIKKALRQANGNVQVAAQALLGE